MLTLVQKSKRDGKDKVIINTVKITESFYTDSYYMSSDKSKENSCNEKTSIHIWAHESPYYWS